MLQTTVRTIILSFFILVSAKLFAAPGNDLCASATNLIPQTTCGATTGQTVYQATTTGSPTSTCGTTYDVWYTFTVPAGITSINIDVTPTGGGPNMDNTNSYIEVFDARTCGAVTAINSLGCFDIGTTVTYSGLTAGIVYYFRVFTKTNPSSQATKWNFSVCVSYTPPPANDDCAGAVTLSNAVTNSSGTVWLATASSGIPAGCATGTPDDDVWYKFIPSGIYLNVSLSAIGTNLNSSGTRLQLFSSSGTCATLTSIACGTTSITDTVTNGATYYIRVYSAGTGSIGGIAAGSAFSITATATAQVMVTASRMNEVYEQTILSPATVLNYPWEITYGPDNNLWITESKGYMVYRMDPTTGVKTTVLDISQGSTFLPVADRTFNCQFANGSGAQGGLAGLALHPNFLDGTASEKNYVYLSYIFSSDGGSSPTGLFYTNRLVRFTFNAATNKLETPVLISSLPGSSDHNSQRMIIAPVITGGTKYLFYGSGDMGSGQFGNRTRANNAQTASSLEGKILRFNLDTAGGVPWIPVTNPYSSTSPVYSIGIRNNQGFAYDTALNILYGSSHGPYSDDEINIIQPFKNYGHPLVIGYADGNYNGNASQGTSTSVSAGAPWTDNSGISSCPPVGNETTRMNAINAAAATSGAYKGPLFSAYATPAATIANTWATNPGNAGWYSEAWSGLDLYQNKIIPGWKQSLVAAGLKWGRLIRLKLGSTGITTLPSNLDSLNTADTITYFQSTNRYRDLAFAPNGKDVFLVMDNSSATSGPGVGNPVVPGCPGCVVKYTFLGYADASGKSSIPTSIDVTDGTVNTCNTGTTVTIDNSNNNLWVPITGPDGNILAEIYPNGNNLGIVTSSFYKRSGSIRIKNGTHYLDRNITITPQNQPSTPVKIRLYISKVEFDALDADPVSGISAITDLKILKNTDPCSSSIGANTTLITPSFAEAHGSNGYMLQGNISGFSSFYFSGSNVPLPLDLLTFSGSLQNNSSVLLKWKTENEINTSHFLVERSIDGNNYNTIGTISSNGNNITGSIFNYSFSDIDATNQQSLLLYYRLKIVDRDGSFKYSGIITISLADITGKIIISPNPAISEVKVNISAPANGRILWKLIDNTGRVVMQNSENIRKGNGNNFTIDISKLSRGSYYLNVSGANIDQNIKLQKL